MKLNILAMRPVKPVQHVIRKGWLNYNGFDEYADFERDVFSIPNGAGANIYIQQVVTLYSPKGDNEYTEAYMVIKQNNPDGDHDESESIPLDVEVAVAMCLEEVK